MNVEFIEPAAIELDDAVDYYNIQSAGLGQKFLDEVIETIGFIEKFSQLWSLNTENTRKAILRNMH
jgi:hypothetical protein